MTKCGSATLLWLAVCALVFSSCGGGSSAPGNPQDSTIPVIDVSGVSHGLSVQDLVGISAQASDPVGIDSLTLYIDNQVISRSPGGELAYDWDTLRLEDGWIPVAFMAKDSAGNRGYAAMAVWIGNGSPTPVGPPPDVEPPIIVDPVPPAPKPDPPPPPPPPPPPDPGPQPILGSGTEEDPFKIAVSDTRDPGLPYVLLLGIEIGKNIWGLWHADIICSDDKGVQELRVYAGMELLGESDNGTYSMLLDTTKYEDGLLNINLALYDGDYHYTCDVMVFITNESDHDPPAINMDSENGMIHEGEVAVISNAMRFDIDAKDQSGIESLKLYVGGELVDEVSGDNTAYTSCWLDPLDYPDYDPNQAVIPGFYIDYERWNKDEPKGKYVTILASATDKAGNGTSVSIRLKLENRVLCRGWVTAEDYRDLRGARLWAEVQPPGAPYGDVEIVECIVDEDQHFDFPNGIPLGDWLMHCEESGEEVSFQVHVDRDTGLDYMYVPALGAG